MRPELTEHEVRVLGCLLEKSVTTPDQYPLTLNALCNACNQKSGRDPVMTLDKGQVERAASQLAEKHLVKVEENFRTGVKKFHQRFCNTGIHSSQFDSAQYACLCLLLLRGPQTPGELRARSPRLHEFDDNSAVTQSLQTLISDDADALVIKLPRTPGRKDSQYMHLLGGAIDVEALAAESSQAAEERKSSRVSVSELAERVTALETELAELKARLGES